MSDKLTKRELEEQLKAANHNFGVQLEETKRLEKQIKVLQDQGVRTMEANANLGAEVERHKENVAWQEAELMRLREHVERIEDPNMPRIKRRTTEESLTYLGMQIGEMKVQLRDLQARNPFMTFSPRGE